MDGEDFLGFVKQNFEKPENGVIIDECVRQELMFYLGNATMLGCSSV